jgi:hypothetical protein
MFSMKSSVYAGLAAFILGGTFLVGPRATAQAGESAALPAASQAPAQPPAPSVSAPSHAAPARPHGMYRRRTIDDRVKQLAKALDLNETQQAGVKAVLEHQQIQARKIQFEQGVDGNERIGRLRALQEDTVLRIRALLNDEQKKKYDPLSHAQPNATPSDSYVDQWMKHHQPPAGQPAPAAKN